MTVEELEAENKRLHAENYRLVEQVRHHQEMQDAFSKLLWTIDEKFFGGMFKALASDKAFIEKMKKSQTEDWLKP